MSLACQKGYILNQADITGAYLISYLRDIVYMEPPLPTCEGPTVAHSVTHKIVSSFAELSAVYTAQSKAVTRGLNICMSSC